MVLGLHHCNRQALLDSSAALGVTVQHGSQIDKHLVHGFHPVLVVGLCIHHKEHLNALYDEAPQSLTLTIHFVKELAKTTADGVNFISCMIICQAAFYDKIIAFRY